MGNFNDGSIFEAIIHFQNNSNNRFVWLDFIYFASQVTQKMISVYAQVYILKYFLAFPNHKKKTIHIHTHTQTNLWN